jgi:hypothetical protein
VRFAVGYVSADFGVSIITIQYVDTLRLVFYIRGFLYTVSLLQVILAKLYIVVAIRTWLLSFPFFLSF